MFDFLAVENSRKIVRLAVAIALVVAISPSRPACAQTGGEEFVELNLAGSVSLPRLVEAVSRQLEIRFLYSADLANRQVTVFTPARLPKSALPALLGSLLKGENLAVVESDVPGWKRIVDVGGYRSLCLAGRGGRNPVP